jgi:hypothetical protein
VTAMQTREADIPKEKAEKDKILNMLNLRGVMPNLKIKDVTSRIRTSITIQSPQQIHSESSSSYLTLIDRNAYRGRIKGRVGKNPTITIRSI